MKKIVVTGGAGYVGSHVMWALHDCGYKPQAIDRITGGGHRDNLKGLPLIATHYTSPAVEHVLADADAIIHCAALTSAPESVEQPGEYYRQNVGDMTYLLDIAAKHSIPVIFSSSAAVYGPGALDGIVRENHMIKPPNPYGSTKAVGEGMLHDWGLRYVALRYFNVAGADTQMRCGPRGDKGTLFSNIIKAARAGKPVTLHMAAGDTSDGFPRRDFIHPTDLAMAHVAAVEALLEGQEINEALNVGSGQGHSIMEVVKQFRTCCQGLEDLIDEPRPGDPANVVADPSRIEKVLGWRATEWSTLPKMVGSAWRWSLKEDMPNKKRDGGPAGRPAGFLDQFS